MKLAADLISDLHIETWDETLDWDGQATSPVCIIAGDVCRDVDDLGPTLEHISNSYQTVFYIDGNNEHRWRFDSLGESYREINDIISNLPNVVYLQDNLVIMEGVAFLGTNGWWDYGFDTSMDFDQCLEWTAHSYKISQDSALELVKMAYIDAEYLVNSVKKLQVYQDIKQIVITTHTVPHDRFIQHDISLTGTYLYNVMGNSQITQCLAADSENKISHWLFGHYHQMQDILIDGIRWISNPRGRGESLSPYYPKRIEF